MPVAGDFPLFSGLCDGSALIPFPASRRNIHMDDGHASRPRPRSGGTLRDPDLGSRHQVGGNDGEGRACGLRSGLEIVGKPKDVKGSEVLYRLRVVERIFAGISRCRRPAKDYERSSESSLAWAPPAACRFMAHRIG